MHNNFTDDSMILLCLQAVKDEKLLREVLKDIKDATKALRGEYQMVVN